VSAGDPSAPAVLAIDGGNSKTDLALVAADGRLLAALRGPTISHQQVGLDAGMARLAELTTTLRGRAGQNGRDPAAIAVGTLAGADSIADTRRLTAAIAGLGLATETMVRNDTFAPVRAGSDRGWGVAVICGAGVNAAGIAPDGRTARFAALGPHAGDRGGGGDIGMAALGAAVRARDGRGPRTTLERSIPAHFGLHRPSAVTTAVESGRIELAEIRHLAPLVFEAAANGDVVAQDILDGMADELVTMATAIIRRLHLVRRDVPVTLAGGVFRATDPRFEGRIADGIHAVAGEARIRKLGAPPVIGAALLGLDALAARSGSAGAGVAARLRGDLTEEAVQPI
jgi:N-acetylglucosamine kinase-like BadF-type ATPase